MATTVAFSDLDTWLQSQPANTASTPYELEITGLTADDVASAYTTGTLGDILKQNNTKYVDLSSTIIPNTVTEMNFSFAVCTTLVYAPVIPNTCTKLYSTFRGTSLITAPSIPASVVDMYRTFYECSLLTESPVIPDNVTKLKETFYGCSALTTFSIKSFNANTIEDYTYVFRNCSNLTNFNSDTPYELKTWLSAIYSESTANFPNNPNNCTFSLYSEVAEIPFSNLDNELGALSDNTTSTPYKIKVTGLTENDIVGTWSSETSLGHILVVNYSKYVDLSETILPEVTNLDEVFSSCNNLIVSPPIPNTVTSLNMSFQSTGIVNTPVIPNNVTNLSGTFNSCRSLVNVSPIPNSVTSIKNCFLGCSSLINAPVIPNSVTDIYGAFQFCTSLKTAKFEKGTVSAIRYYSNVFYSCNNLTDFYCDEPYELKTWLNTIHTASSDNFPNDVADCHFYFYSEVVEMNVLDYTLNQDLHTVVANTTTTPYKLKLTGITNNVAAIDYIQMSLYSNSTKYVDLSETVIPTTITHNYSLSGCVSLIKAPNVPSSLTTIRGMFKNCSNLAEIPLIPESVTSLEEAFSGCTSLITIEKISSSVTNLTKAFYGCSSLESIEEFDVPLSVLKTNAEDCFDGCTSLTSIGVQGVAPITEAPQWHAIRLNFGASDVSGKVYDKDKNTTTIPQTTIQKGTLKLPIKTDELWFPPSNLTDAQVDEVIESVIDTKRTYFNKPVLNPLNKSFVLWKDSQSQFVSNIDFGGSGGSGITVYPTQEELEQDLPNLQDGTIVGTYGDDNTNYNDAPLGSVMSYLGTTDPSDGKWLICDGRDTTGTAIELETHYPSLYMFLGGTNVLPDLREIVFVGAGQNGTETIANHDVYTVGQFKDDQIQNITGQIYIDELASGYGSGSYTPKGAFANLGTKGNTTTRYNSASGNYKTYDFDASRVARAGTTTHGKQIGVNYIIKAVSSVDYYHAPASEITQVESYVDNGLNTIKNNGLSYSTTETWTGGKWIDGKKIYRKVFKEPSLGAWTNNTTIGSIGSDFENIVNITSVGAVTAGNIYVNNCLSTSTRFTAGVSYSNNKGNVFVLRADSSTNTILFTVCVEYTKTTD